MVFERGQSAGAARFSRVRGVAGARYPRSTTHPEDRTWSAYDRPVCIGWPVHDAIGGALVAWWDDTNRSIDLAGAGGLLVVATAVFPFRFGVIEKLSATGPAAALLRAKHHPGSCPCGSSGAGRNPDAAPDLPGLDSCDRDGAGVVVPDQRAVSSTPGQGADLRRRCQRGIHPGTQ